MHYTSKHAAPVRRHLKARLAGVGITAAATVGVGFATASQAQAASVWDTVAQCETGQNWAETSAPGYSGGLGFLNKYWGAFGGKQYSALPYQATREQQIAVAQRILAVNGPGAWPVCGPRAGLTKSNGGGSVQVSGGSGSSSAPSASRSSTRTKTVTKAPTRTRTVTKAPTRVVTQAPTRTKTVTRAPARTVTSAPAVSGSTYVVRTGDTLSAIAQRLGVKGGWPALFAANTSTVKNANLIYTGQSLRLPA